MNESIHKYLIEIDRLDWSASSVQKEFGTSMQEIEKLKPELDKLVGEEFEMGQYAQDANFLTDVGLYHVKRHPKGALIKRFKLVVRFSEYGRLFSIIGPERNNLSNYPINEIKTMLEARDFVFASTEALHRDYQGKPVSSESGTWSWWNRFFDYE